VAGESTTSADWRRAIVWDRDHSPHELGTLDHHFVNQEAGSPEGAWMATPVATGVPKLGVPSAFHVNFCARVDRLMSQPALAELFA
jgi:hypothetical protein